MSASKKKTLYLAGKITGDPNYKAKFDEAARDLTNQGFIVLSPAILPSEGFGYGAYMRMSCAMMDECDIVAFLPDWKNSKGALREYQRALDTGKWISLLNAKDEGAEL